MLIRSWNIARRVAVQTYEDGFVLAGNFAYLALLAVFPFFIVAAALAGMFGRSDYGGELMGAFLAAVPPSVGSVIRDPVLAAMHSRSGGVLWLAVAVGLWTTGSLIESIRDMIRRAYRFESLRPFWHYRLGSIAVIVGTVFFTIFVFSAQVLLSGAEQMITLVWPFQLSVINVVALSQLATTIILFGTLFALFRILTPRRFLRSGCPVWPGALFISLWWMLMTSLLPVFIANFARYDLTYGSLAGVMISLIFFFLIGLAMVIGAELNAALAGETEAEEAAERKARQGRA